MATLVVKNLPEPLHAQLKAHAQANHRSVTKEVVALIEQALKGQPRAALEPPPPLKLRDGPATIQWIEAAIHDGRE